jgi:ubiquinone/menaquinone biosynthesis C-methylase UbiE
MAIVRDVRDRIEGGRILDIGVGGGRTTAGLTSISTNYVGIDYSSEMIRICKNAFPQLDLRVCDARDLSVFSDEEFDFVFFSFNGIDLVSHDDRLRILAEVLRVLKPAGIFAFSSHNLGQRGIGAFKWVVHWNPFLVLYCNTRNLVNHSRNRRFEVHTDAYSIINDSARGYSTLTYYIRVKDQIDQLRSAGFKGRVQCYDRAGKQADVDCKDPWVYYCVQK